MPSVLKTLFLTAAGTASEYCIEAARNANVLKRKKDDINTIDSSNMIRPFASHQFQHNGQLFIGDLDLDKVFVSESRDYLLSWFELNNQAQLRFILLGCVTDGDRFTPTFARDSFDLHSIIQAHNGCVHAIKAARNDLRDALGSFCDALMLRARLLQEALTHAAMVSEDEHVVAFLKKLMGLQVGDPLAPEQEGAAADRHQHLVDVYHSRFQIAAAELIANAYNKDVMTEWLKDCPIPLRVAPVWFICGYSDEDSIINDTWIPKRWGEPLMQTIIEEQAKAMAPQGG